MEAQSPSQARCPACASLQSRSDAHIAFCELCGHRWLVISEEAHRGNEEKAYIDDYSGYARDERFEAFVRDFTARELGRRLRAGARILDVGCGAGVFMEAASKMGYSVEGIDVSHASAEICRRKGLAARAGDFLTDRFDGKFDLITMWDVVEHLRDPESFLHRSRELLVEDGLLFAKIPAFGDLSVRLSRRVPRLAGILLGAPNHVQYFSRASLDRLVRRQGFEPEWLAGGAIRSPTRGGSLKTRLGRIVQRVVKAASGDSNLFLLAGRA
jgi:SAM-dependent methyltransferase